MAPFLTEKQTEAWLEMETRDLPMMDGTTRSFTDTKALCNAYDFILDRAMFTHKQIIEFALHEGKELKLPFEISFPHVVSYAYNRLRDRLGIDEPD